MEKYALFALHFFISGTDTCLQIIRNKIDASYYNLYLFLSNVYAKIRMEAQNFRFHLNQQLIHELNIDYN